MSSTIFTPFTEEQLIPKEEKLEVLKKGKKFSIGIPKETCLHEKRPCITPDAVQVLVEHGHDIILEAGAGEGSFFTDLQFSEAGAQITTSQAEVYGQDKIQAIFNRAKVKWSGVFSDDAKIELTASHLSVCVSSLQDVKLFNSNLDVVDDAFEYLIGKSSKGEKGQYFTPRYVIDMCVKMLNPQEHETMIDTAAGSCGFPVHTIFHVWKQIFTDLGLAQSHLFTLEQKPPRCTDYVNDKAALS